MRFGSRIRKIIEVNISLTLPCSSTFVFQSVDHFHKQTLDESTPRYILIRKMNYMNTRNALFHPRVCWLIHRSQFTKSSDRDQQWRTEGGLGCSTPPRNSEGPPKSCQTQPNLWKLLKIAEFRTPTPQDVRKKGSKIPKPPRFAIVLH